MSTVAKPLLVEDLTNDSAGPVYDVVAAQYTTGFSLNVSFSDGASQVVDFGPFLAKATHPSLAKYRSPDAFKQFHILNDNLVWGDDDSMEMVFPIHELHAGTIELGS